MCDVIDDHIPTAIISIQLSLIAIRSHHHHHHTHVCGLCAIRLTINQTTRHQWAAKQLKIDTYLTSAAVSSHSLYQQPPRHTISKRIDIKMPRTKSQREKKYFQLAAVDIIISVV